VEDDDAVVVFRSREENMMMDGVLFLGFYLAFVLLFRFCFFTFPSIFIKCVCKIPACVSAGVYLGYLQP